MLSFYNVLNILYKSLQTYPIYKYTCCNIIFQKLLEMGDSKCFMNWLFPNNFITFADWFIFIQRKLLLFVKKEIQQLFLLLVLHVSQMEKQRGGWYKKKARNVCPTHDWLCEKAATGWLFSRWLHQKVHKSEEHWEVWNLTWKLIF